jgi:hypothetical protein
LETSEHGRNFQAWHHRQTHELSREKFANERSNSQNFLFLLLKFPFLVNTGIFIVGDEFSFLETVSVENAKKIRGSFDTSFRFLMNVDDLGIFQRREGFVEDISPNLSMDGCSACRGKLREISLDLPLWCESCREFRDSSCGRMQLEIRVRSAETWKVSGKWIENSWKISEKQVLENSAILRRKIGEAISSFGYLTISKKGTLKFQGIV